MKPWKRWQDWFNVAAGLWLAISMWVLSAPGPQELSTIPLVFGAVLVLAALYALWRPASTTAEFLVVLFGALTFLSPWMANYGAGARSWNAWIVGTVAVILAIWGYREITQRLAAVNREKTAA